VSTLTVEIDVKPDSDTNPINLASNGLNPVVVFTTDTFDASIVNINTVRFAGAAPAHDGHFEDVDDDGDQQKAALANSPPDLSERVMSGSPTAVTSQLVMRGWRHVAGCLLAEVAK